MRRHFQCRENPGEEVCSPISRAFWSLIRLSPLSLNDLEEKLGDVIFPFDAVVPDNTKEWFTVYATSRGSTRKLLLISALTSTSALIGKTTVKVFGKYEEPANLFMITVAPSGSGKTPACHLGCTGPIVGHIEPVSGQLAPETIRPGR